MGGRHYYLAKELAKQGHKVFLVAASYTHLLHKLPVVNDAFKVESTDGFSFVWVGMPKYDGAHDKKRVLNWFRFGWKLLSLPKVIPENPNVILYSSPALMPFLGAKRLAKRLKAKLVFEVRDIWPLTLVALGGYSPRHPFIRLMQWVEDRAYQKSDVVVSNLYNAVEHMVERGMKREKFSWIPNGLSLVEAAEAEPLSERVLASLPENKFIVGYTGTFGLANALDSFIDAAVLTKDNDALAWVLVGGGKEKQDLQVKCETLNLKNVYLIDAIPKAQVQSMLKCFDVTFIAAKANPMYRFGVSPNKLFDYLYAGKPIIFAIDSGKYMPVTEANAGCSIPAENPQEIVDAALKIKKMTQAQRDQLGQNGRDFVMKNHDYAKLAVKLSKVLLG